MEIRLCSCGNQGTSHSEGVASSLLVGLEPRLVSRAGREGGQMEPACLWLPLTFATWVPAEGAGILCSRPARVPAQNLKKVKKEILWDLRGCGPDFCSSDMVRVNGKVRNHVGELWTPGPQGRLASSSPLPCLSPAISPVANHNSELDGNSGKLS